MNIKLMPLLANSLINRLKGRAEDSQHIDLDDLNLSSSADVSDISASSKKLIAAALIEEFERELGQFGLKTAEDVEKFLEKTPAGERVREYIIEEFIKKIEEQKQLKQEIMEEEFFRNRLIAYLLMKLARAEDREEYIKRINDYVQEQIEKILHHQDAQKLLKPEEKEELTGLLEVTEKLEKEVQDELNDKFAEKDKIQQEFIKINEYEETIEKRYTALNSGVDKLDKVDTDLAKLQDEEKIKTEINNQIEDIKAKLDAQVQEIDALVADGKDKQAMDLLHHHNNLHLQAAGLKDMLAVYSGEKKYYDENDEEVSSFKDAAYVHKPDQKIIVHDGKSYLVNNGVNDINKLSDKERREAHAKYQDSVAIKNLVKSNQKAEREFHGKRLQNNTERSHSIDQEITQLKNKLEHLQATKASIQAELKKPNHDLGKAQRMENSRPTISSGSPLQLQSFLVRALDRELRAEQAQQARAQTVTTPQNISTPKVF
ncbi:hypothetical protein ACNVED_09805 [Legionella sp. D16C41]|uniref:hypothetical protein n=1 Tax=Legionella sp. D16C41 TaxID=3402688 RepID=UPI003AF84FDF